MEVDQSDDKPDDDGKPKNFGIKVVNFQDV